MKGFLPAPNVTSKIHMFYLFILLPFERFLSSGLVFHKRCKKVTGDVKGSVISKAFDQSRNYRVHSSLHLTDVVAVATYLVFTTH